MHAFSNQFLLSLLLYHRHTKIIYIIDGVRKVSYFKTIKNIKSGKVAPVYLLFGQEAYFIQTIIQAIISEKLQDDSENLSTYDLTETPLMDVMTDAETFPFFGDHKVIIANQAVFFQSRPPKLSIEHELYTLEQYVEQPSPTTTLIVVAPFESIDGRKKITRALRKHAVVVECHPIKEYELNDWIKRLAKHLHLSITPEAIDLLSVNLSTNLNMIQNELTKCSQYIEDGETITKSIVMELLSHTPVSSALQLVDAVIERDLFKAMTIYEDLKLNNEDPIGLIALLAYQFRMILQVKLYKKKGYTEYQLRQKLGVHPYVVKIAYKRERRFSMQQLKEIINDLTNCDTQIKRGEMSDQLAFEQLLYRLTEAS